MSASTNFNFPSHPTSRSHALQIVEGTRALQQSPMAYSTSASNTKKSNYAESTTSTSSFSSRTGLLKEKFRSSYGSSSSDNKSKTNSNKSSSIRMGH